MGVKLYALLLAAVGMGRLIELRLSRANQRALAARGISVARESHFPWMVLLHAGVLASSGIEVGLAKRPWVPALAILVRQGKPGQGG